ncbi:MAG: single-stranded DNA-binding protein [Fimbriimonadales bacterium]
MFYNKIVLVGRLTRDPEHRTTPDGMSVVRFTLAVERPVRPGGERITDFFDIVAFSTLGERVANYTAKGHLVLVEGRLQTRSYTDREGQQRKVFEIVANEVRFLERRREEMDDVPMSEPPPTARAVRGSAPAPRRQPEPPADTEPDYDDIAMEVFDDLDDDNDPFR